MTFSNRLGLIVPGMGTPISDDAHYLAQNQALTSSTTVTLPSTGSWAAPEQLKNGWIRIKVYNGIGTSPTLTGYTITFTDGTTTVQISQSHPSTAITLSTTSWVDHLIPFLLDIVPTSMSVAFTLGGTSPGATADVEVSGDN